MKTIGASEAKTNFSELLEQIAQGQRFTITKRGKPTAMLVPLDEEPAITPDQAVATLRAVRSRLTLGDVRLKDLIAEGRR
jgi:prevent-host-death family protein